MTSTQLRFVPWIIGLAAATITIAGIHYLAQAGDPNRRVYLGQSPGNLLEDIFRALAYLPPEIGSLPDPPPFWTYSCGYHYLAPFALRQEFWSAAVFAALGGFLWRWRHWAGGRSAVTACLGCLMIGQTFLAADYRVNGPHASRAARPRNVDTDDLQRAGPEQFQVPSEPAVAALGRRLETDRYRTVVLARRHWGMPAPHIGPFWRLRLMEGYGSAIPTRLYALPFPAATFHGRRAIGYHRPEELDWRFLAWMNVKYAVVANEALYRNAVALPGGGWREAAPSDLAILENPCPVVPRVFFAGRVRAVDRPRAAVLALFGGHVFQIRGDLDPLLPGPEPSEDFEKDIPDPRTESIVEGNLPAEDFTAEGPIEARFNGDRIDVEVTPCDRPRFLVLNERFHPGWTAAVDGRDTPIFPTNVSMRGLIVPPGTTRVVLQFRPGVTAPAAWGTYAAALMLLVAGAVYLRKPALTFSSHPESRSQVP